MPNNWLLYTIGFFSLSSMDVCTSEDDNNYWVYTLFEKVLLWIIDVAKEWPLKLAVRKHDYE